MNVLVVEPDAGNCMQCRSTKRKMDQFGIEYQTSVASKEDALIKELNVMQAPLVVVSKDGERVKFWTGFRPDEIKSLRQMMELVAA